MAKILTESAVEKLRIEAKVSGNNPAKIAKYSAAKREYQTIVNAIFDEDYPYVSSASDSYLARLKEAAELPEATEVDIARYEIIRDRKENGAGPDAKVLKATAQELRQALADGTALTEADVKEAARLVVQNSSTDNRVLHATLKTRLQQQKDGTVPVNVDPPQERKVTVEDIESARDKAAQTSRMEDRVAYSSLKATYASQSAEEAAAQ